MALYAILEDEVIHAKEAISQKIYRCIDCRGAVKRRRSSKYLYHFYHINTPRNCRLYSKTEDHMLAQLQVQKLFPAGVITLERPFIEISRIADCCWEAEKIVFEVQCSAISEKEVECRTEDYRFAGYEVIWLLDDRRYNRRALRPEEAYLRTLSAYYLQIRQDLTSKTYDQLEVFEDKRRVRRGYRLPINLTKISTLTRTFDAESFPAQIVNLKTPRYCAEGRLSLTENLPLMLYWRALELQFKEKFELIPWLEKKVFSPYRFFLDEALKKEH